VRLVNPDGSVVHSIAYKGDGGVSPGAFVIVGN
jgi:hypothetical protein